MAKNKEITKKTGQWNDKFVKPAFILSIISVATSILIIGGLIGIPAIVFSALGQKTHNPELKAKAKKSLIMSIVGTSVGCAIFAILMLVLFIFVLAQLGYPGGN